MIVSLTPSMVSIIVKLRLLPGLTKSAPDRRRFQCMSSATTVLDSLIVNLCGINPSMLGERLDRSLARHFKTFYQSNYDSF